MSYPVNSKDVTISLRALSSFGSVSDKVAADFSIWYRVGATGAITQIALHDLSAEDDPHEDGGILSLGDGWYRFDVPDALFTVGGVQVLIGGSVESATVISGWLDVDDLKIAGTVVAGTDPATTMDFATDLPEVTEDAYVDVCCVFTSGNLRGEARFIAAYLAPDGVEPSRLAVDLAMSAVPQVGDKFILIGKRG